MSKKTLSASNHYLKQANSAELIARNLATSTAVETGKPADIYFKRYMEARGLKSGDGAATSENAQETTAKSRKKSGL